VIVEVAAASAMLVLAQAAPGGQAYVTSAPAPEWLGLATLGGRDAIQLGEGCAGVVPGVNVVMDEDGELQVVDPINGIDPSACEVVNRVHVSDVPCATSRIGVCDVAFS
jgi:hypothetical protein